MYVTSLFVIPKQSKVIPLGLEPKTHALEGRCSNPTELRNLTFLRCKITLKNLNGKALCGFFCYFASKLALCSVGRVGGGIRIGFNKIDVRTDVFKFETLTFCRRYLTPWVNVISSLKVFKKAIVASDGGGFVDVGYDGVILILELLEFLDVHHSLDAQRYFIPTSLVFVEFCGAVFLLRLMCGGRRGLFRIVSLIAVILKFLNVFSSGLDKNKINTRTQFVALGVGDRAVNICLDTIKEFGSNRNFGD